MLVKVNGVYQHFQHFFLSYIVINL